MFLLFITLVLFQLDAVNPQYEYCKLKCIVNGKEVLNIACTFYYCLPLDPRKCRPFNNVNKANFRKAILNAHNSLRRDVADGKIQLGGESLTISNMNALNYDFELEHLAMCVANKCSFGDRCVRSLTHETIGSNVAHAYAAEVSNRTLSAAGWTNLAKQWWPDDALASFDKGLIGKFEFTNLEAYEKSFELGRVLWAKTTSVGCAGSLAIGKPYLPKFWLVCTYAPDVVAGQNVFELGDPCTKCDSGKKCGTQYASLCGDVVLKPVESKAAIARNGPVIIWFLFQCVFANVLIVVCF